jgi:hypothetical protein
MSISAHAPEQRGFGVRGIGWRPVTAPAWIVAAFVIGFALAAIVLAIFGAGEPGTVLALRVTARWSFLLFWLAYAGGAMATLCGPRLDGLARHGRELGLAFASAQLVHIGLVLWIRYIAAGPGGMIFFWVGILSTYLLVLFSVPRLRISGGYSVRSRLNTLPSSSPSISFSPRCKRAGSAGIR